VDFWRRGRGVFRVLLAGLEVSEVMGAVRWGLQWRLGDILRVIAWFGVGARSLEFGPTKWWYNYLCLDFSLFYKT
jgi:hypothetical protein